MALHRPHPFDFQSNPAARSAWAVASRLRGAGFEAVVAGGAVRDLLLDRQPKDFDIATSAPPDEVLALFKGTRAVGVAFGVVLVNEFEETVEVATFRKDMEYVDGRRPEGVVFTDAATDAKRRDFTVNGLFYDPSAQEVIDHVGGLEDLESRTLRAIGVASERFAEDYLRMVRAVRFAVTIDFSIEGKTWVALQEHAHHLSQIAPDRIHEELRRTFQQGRSDLGLGLLRDSGLLKVIFPKAHDAWTHHPDPTGGDLSAVLSLLMVRMDERPMLEELLAELRCTNGEKQDVTRLVADLGALPEYLSLGVVARKRLVRKHLKERLLFCVRRLPHLGTIVPELEHNLNSWKSATLHPKNVPLGKHLATLGVRPGPAMGDLLRWAEDRALEHDGIDFKQLMEMLRSRIEELCLAEGKGEK